ncbi:MAG: zinc ribbon domain-containing protein [Promethearchaeota archaeon]
MGNQRTPEQKKKRRIVLMRITFISLLVGNGISIFTSIVLSLDDINEYLGDPAFPWVTTILGFSKSLTLISATLAIAGGILLLIALAKIGEGGSLKLKSTSKIAFLLLLIGLVLNFAFTYILTSLELWGVLTGQNIETLLKYTPLITIGVDSAFYLFLGFTLRQLNNEYQLGNRPLITTFVYPITFALRLILLFNLFSSVTEELIATLIVSVMGLVILIVFFSRALIGLKRVKNKISKGVHSKVLPTSKGAKFCANCGARLESIASFCANCGHPKE